ncbi:MAG: tetratricopeptide repeat protein [Gemmatimonadales bacterium]
MGVIAPPHTRRAVLVAVLVAAVVAAPAIRNEFVADDQWVIAHRQVLEDPPSIGAVLQEPYWPKSFGGVMWRPAVISSFAIDYRVSSSPHWFHAVNIFWTAIATALFTLLACELAGPSAGLIVGLLFAVHPVHVEAIANVVGRAELMAGAGYALALVCAIRAAQGRAASITGVALGAVLAIGSKEIAVTLPAAVYLVVAARGLDLRAAWRPAVAATMPILAYFVMHRFVGIRTFYGGGLAVGLEHLGLVQRTWAMVPLSLQWWRLLLFPAHLSADYSPGELTVSTGLTLWHVLGLLVWIGLGVLAWRTRRTIPGIAVGLAWLVITISPVANVVMPGEFLIAERTLYLPSFGVVLALGCAVMAIRSPRLRAAILGIVVVAGAMRSIARVPAWHDDETHYQALRREAPRSYRTLWLEGKDEFAAGRWSSGERLLLTSIALAPSLAGPRYDLATFYMQAKLWQPAVAQLRAAVAVDSAFTPARDALQQALQAADTAR